MNIDFTEQQKKCISGAANLLKGGQEIVTIAGAAGTGKAQPNSTKIPTPFGYKLLGDLKIGDIIFDRNGKETRVTGVFPQGVKDNYEIIFSDNRIAHSCNEHLWTYITSKGNLKTEELQSFIKNGLYKTDKRGHKSYKYSIPSNKAVEYSKKEFDIDPYVIGCFLGDGCCLERQLTISSADEELVKEISNLIKAKNYIKNSDSNYSWNFNFNEDYEFKTRKNNIRFLTRIFFKGFENEIIQESKYKRIPNEYKLGSISQRLSLVQGLLDTDGSIQNDDKRFNIRFSNTSLGLVEDLQEILQSLGYSSTSIEEDKRKDRNICYNLNINIPNNEKEKLFRLSRKKRIAIKAKNIIKNKNYDRATIRSIKKIGECEMTCISVDNSEQLYLTEHFVVTHNTTLVGSIVKELGFKPIEVEYVAFTGKAALVLKRKGIPGKTIHSLIYNYVKDDFGNHRFELKPALDNPFCRLIVIDEISMVGESLLKDIRSFGIRLLCLGDPFQLEPVLDEPTNLLKNADFLLTEIHRQAANNPIINFSFKIREKETLQYLEEDNDNIRVIPVNNLSMPVLLWADQVLCSTHRVRESLNKQIRLYKGFTKDIPEMGDKIICLKNYKNEIAENAPEHLVNGMVGFVTQIYTVSLEPHRAYMDIEFRPDYDQNIRFKTRIDLNTFLGYNPYRNANSFNRGKGYKPIIRCHFDFAYVITIHKSQGSEWEKVAVYSNDYWGDRHKLAYTAVTRAQEKLVYIQ